MTQTHQQIRSQILELVREYYDARWPQQTFHPGQDLVHYAGRVFDAEEIVNLIDAGLDFYLTANHYAERFEADFADYFGVGNALLVNSGSSANRGADSPTSLSCAGSNQGTKSLLSQRFLLRLPIVQNQLVPVC